MTLYAFLNMFEIFLFVVIGIIYSILIEKYLQNLYRKEREK